jgi:hypothetical protein
MEWPTYASCASFLIQRLGDGQGLGVDLQNGAQGRPVTIERFDPIAVKLDELSRAQPSRLHQPLQLSDRSFFQAMFQQPTPGSGNPY